VVGTLIKKTHGRQLPELVQKNGEVGIDARAYAGAKSYADGDNHEKLFCRGKSSASCLNDYRTKLCPEGLWADLKASEHYKAGLEQRYKVAQKNA